MARAAPPGNEAVAAATPFLKWAGGKRQLLSRIRQFYPPHFERYIEPFVGSGAVFFDLASRGMLAGKDVCLMDTNADLIGVYAAIRHSVERVIAHLQELEHGHRAGGASFFYRVRDEQFNPPRRVDGPARPQSDDPSRAAMLIYLNRTCYNGLFRLNRMGEFNTPAGRYANPRICDADNLRRASAILNGAGVRVRVGDFTDTLDAAGPESFVYFDPPYAPASRTANFRSYTATGFSDARQSDLQQLIIRLAARGTRVLLSNSVVPLTKRLYETSQAAGDAGLRAHRVPARRAINSNASGRGTVEEFLISNIAPVSMRNPRAAESLKTVA
jgi:DNA adenine methylase